MKAIELLLEKLLDNNEVKELAWVYFQSKDAVVGELQKRIKVVTRKGITIASINFTDSESGITVKEKAVTRIVIKL